jgi:hypothetical protein
MEHVFYIVVGFVLAWVPQWLDRKRKIRAHWSAIRAEMVIQRENAIEYKAADVLAPLYRLPYVAFTVGLPQLLLEGQITEEENLVIGRYGALVQDINRGLDQATELRGAGRISELHQEYNRLLLKVHSLTQGAEDREALYDAALSILDRKVAQSWWRL